MQIESESSESKARFVPVASHEMRTPLTAILGWAEMLQQTRTLPDDKQIVDTIRACGKSLLGIINNILDYSKFEKGLVTLERIPFNLDALVHDNVESARVLIRPGVKFTLDFDDEAKLRVIGDPHRLSQVITNMVSNAAKFTERGEITLSVRRVIPKNSPMKIAVSFTVMDTGIGMSQETIKRLFQPFMQADLSTTRRFGGTGLGLPITKQLNEGMGGSISVVSTLGVGTTFRWRLEFDQSRQTLSGQQAAAYIEDQINSLNRSTSLSSSLSLSTSSSLSYSSPPLTARALHVLLVEDNKFNQKLLAAALSLENYLVTVAEHGEEALAVAERNFDLILMDIQVPIMDGITATIEIRKRGITTQILGLTANPDDETRTEAMAAGINELMTKPITMAALKRATRQRSSFDMGRS